MIPYKNLQEFARLYENHFGIALTDQEAREAAQRIFNLVRIVYDPVHSRRSRRSKRRAT